MTLICNDSECPSCGSTVAVGIMSLAATCACGFFYVELGSHRGWYSSRDAFLRGEEAIPGRGAEASDE